MAITQKCSFCHYAPRLYNMLLFELRKIDDLSTFKKKLKTFYFEKAYDLENLVINVITKFNPHDAVLRHFTLVYTVIICHKFSL